MSGDQEPAELTETGADQDRSSIATPTSDKNSDRLVPPEPVQIVDELFAMAAMSMRRSSSRDSLVSKLKSEHVTQVLRLSEEKVRNEHELRLIESRNKLKIFQLIIALICLLIVSMVFLFWLFFAYGKSDQVSDIIKTLIIGGGGVGIGTGLRSLVKAPRRDKEEAKG